GRELGEGRATCSTENRIHTRPGPAAAACRYEHLRRDRYRAHRPLCLLVLFERRRRGSGGMSLAPAFAELSPVLRRSLVTLCVMMATIMQALDMTIANVALPYMQGSLSATIDQVSWVLTSYVVAAAIMTAPVGWLARRYGAKNLLMACAAGFTAASMLCGIA